VTAACHWTCFSGGWRPSCLDSHERHRRPYLCDSGAGYKCRDL